jgi:hypothetical protein
MYDKINIPAIHDDDLKAVLERYDLLEKVQSGEITCHLCNDTITWENIYGIFLEENTPKLVCSSANCVETINNLNNG